MPLKDIVALIFVFAFFLVVFAYSVLMLINPVRASELERKYWWHGQRFVMRSNPEDLASSPRKRVSARLGAAALISLLLFVGYAIYEGRR